MTPVLIGVVIGRWLDRTFDAGIFFTAPLIMLAPRRVCGRHGDGCIGNDRGSHAGFAAGAILGAAHLASLWWSVVLLRDGRPILGVLAQALRFVALALALACIARHGAPPLPRRGVRRPGRAGAFAATLGRMA